MARIENVSGTAFVVAEFRAEENAEAAPLYRDSVVGLFLTEETKRAAERVAASFPPVKDLVKIRRDELDGKRLWALEIELEIVHGEHELQAALARFLPAF